MQVPLNPYETLELMISNEVHAHINGQLVYYAEMRRFRSSQHGGKWHVLHFPLLPLLGRFAAEVSDVSFRGLTFHFLVSTQKEGLACARPSFRRNVRSLKSEIIKRLQR